MNTTMTLEQFAIEATPPPAARKRAAHALLDTIGVTLAGASEPAARIVQDVLATESPGDAHVLGTALRLSATAAALANGTAAHALDYDDMCFVSLAHPSAPLVPALLASAEVASQRRPISGPDLLDSYIVGFEIEARLGRAMNPRHYRRGWHCTSTLGTIGAAAAACRLLGLDALTTRHALSIAASEASGLKENFGSMVKPLHAGLAARNGVLAALLARKGLTGSAGAVEGPQGFLAAMDSERPSLGGEAADLGIRWEILDTGITVKLYPSCAGTHPTLDAILALLRRERFAPGDVDRIDIDVDSITPSVLIYENPSTSLEAKFSMHFCAAAAVVFGAVGIDTFDSPSLEDERVRSLMRRVTMRVDPSLDGVGEPLTQARVTIRLQDGRTFQESADGAHGYPDRPATLDALSAKFRTCARRTIGADAAERALALLQQPERIKDMTRILESVNLELPF